MTTEVIAEQTKEDKDVTRKITNGEFLLEEVVIDGQKLYKVLSIQGELPIHHYDLAGVAGQFFAKDVDESGLCRRIYSYESKGWIDKHSKGARYDLVEAAGEAFVMEFYEQDNKCEDVYSCKKDEWIKKEWAYTFDDYIVIELGGNAYVQAIKDAKPARIYSFDHKKWIETQSITVEEGSCYKEKIIIKVKISDAEYTLWTSPDLVIKKVSGQAYYVNNATKSIYDQNCNLIHRWN